MPSAPSHSSTLEPRSGFHPKLTTKITFLRPLGGSNSNNNSNNSTAPASTSSTSSCSLHLLYTLSSSIILDQYQLRQLHGQGRLLRTEQSPQDGHEKGHQESRPISAELYLGGQLDLEAPVSRIDPEQDVIAFLSIPMANSNTRYTQTTLPDSHIPSVDVTVELPLHLRYQEPVLSRWLTEQGRSGFGGGWWAMHPVPEQRQDLVDVQVRWPCVFWACNAEVPETKQGAPLSGVL